MEGVVNIPIQMIVAVDTTGNMTPMRFKFESDDHFIETANIEKIVSRDETNYVGIREKRFICVVIVDELQKVIEIRYNVGTQKWRIFQFLN